MQQQMERGLHCIDIRGGLRIQVVNNTLYVKQVQQCYQSRARSMVHLLLQALQAGPIPDVDIVINCADHPLVSRRPKDDVVPPMLSIATTNQHVDIP